MQKFWYSWWPGFETKDYGEHLILAPTFAVATELAGNSSIYRVRLISKDDGDREPSIGKDRGCISGSAELADPEDNGGNPVCSCGRPKYADASCCEHCWEERKGYYGEASPQEESLFGLLCARIVSSQPLNTAIKDAVGDIVDGLESRLSEIESGDAIRDGLGLYAHEEIITDSNIDRFVVDQNEFDQIEGSVSDHEGRLEDLESANLEERLDTIEETLAKTDEHMTEDQRERFKKVVKECLVELLLEE